MRGEGVVQINVWWSSLDGPALAALWCRYLAVTIGSYYPHQAEPYDSTRDLKKVVHRT